MEQRVRIRDIAEELGLSTATVSNVIHGKTQKISDETVKRVQETLERRQYIPSMAGILLARNASKIIGVFVNDHEKYEGHTLEDAFIASSLNHLSAVIEENSYFLMVKLAKKPEDVLEFSSMWNMDGVVIIGFCQQDYQYLRSHMRIPFVVYDGFCPQSQRFVNITIDNFDGGRQVGQLFRWLGHTRALCLSDNDTAVDQQRMAGFREGFQGQVSTLLIPMGKQARWDFYRRELGRIRSVSAILAVSDYYAVDLIHFLREQGIQIPQQLSVAGFDDIPLCQLVCPTLTTVRQDGALRAKLALESLLALRREEAVETTLCLPVTLVERDSTGPFLGDGL